MESNKIIDIIISNNNVKINKVRKIRRQNKIYIKWFDHGL